MDYVEFFVVLLSLIVFLSVAPSLTRHPGSGELVVKKGSTVSLKCQASGFPSPKVFFFTKNNNILNIFELYSILRWNWMIKDIKCQIQFYYFHRQFLMIISAKAIYILNQDMSAWLGNPSIYERNSWKLFERCLKYFWNKPKKSVFIIFCLRSEAKPPI